VTIVKTGADGSYSYWLAQGSYQVIISRQGHVSQTFIADVIADQSNTYDVDLRLDAPCSDIPQTSFELTIPQGATISQTLTLGNLGAGGLDFTFFESPLPLEVVLPQPPRTRAGAFSAGPVVGPASVQSLAAPGEPAGSPEAPASGWFGGQEIPGGLMHYAFANVPNSQKAFTCSLASIAVIACLPNLGDMMLPQTHGISSAYSQW